MPSDIAVYGLGVMGRNIALNMADRGFRVSVYNRTASVTDAFVAQRPAGSTIVASHDLAELAASLARPRIVFLMATAGKVVDLVIEGLLPHLDAGDIIIDGGNSYFKDSQRRWRELAAHGIRFLGMGISGGEEGARHGPSIMPGGDPTAWPLVRHVFESIAARAEDGEPCCRWVGEGGAGHYVKMIHNGIEYGDMQLIAEAWQLMRDGLGMPTAQIGLLLFREACQGLGYGKETTAATEAALSRVGYRALRLSVVDENVEAKLFWERLGFAIVGRLDRGVTVYEKPLR